MITREQGESMIECMVPHTGTPGDAHPITQIHYHITQKNVTWLGLASEQFEGLPGYDGPETHGTQQVYVFELEPFKKHVADLTLIPGVSVHVVDHGRGKERKI